MLVRALEFLPSWPRAETGQKLGRNWQMHVSAILIESLMKRPSGQLCDYVVKPEGTNA